ncbi:hypothetical protein V6N13_074933 [Hibiscus sabdariffa]|uniref:Uncharacterized protein n=1 Tax=Hibiscus sabdariffa TaxID=183260 RepID=A0ABR2U9X5_9ROSI
MENLCAASLMSLGLICSKTPKQDSFEYGISPSQENASISLWFLQLDGVDEAIFLGISGNGMANSKRKPASWHPSFSAKDHFSQQWTYKMSLLPIGGDLDYSVVAGHLSETRITQASIYACQLRRHLGCTCISSAPMGNYV